jgi:hypothetical protein
VSEKYKDKKSGPPSPPYKPREEYEDEGDDDMEESGENNVRRHKRRDGKQVKEKEHPLEKDGHAENSDSAEDDDNDLRDCSNMKDQMVHDDNSPQGVGTEEIMHITEDSTLMMHQVKRQSSGFVMKMMDFEMRHEVEADYMEGITLVDQMAQGGGGG